MLTKNMFGIAAAVIAAAGVLALAKDDGPIESVKYAKSWEAAIEEAKTLNVPIVVHSHGFY
jgi:hypothetical protein